MKIKNFILGITDSNQSYRVARNETKKCINNIKLKFDNYEFDAKIDYIIKENIKIKYKAF